MTYIKGDIPGMINLFEKAYKLVETQKEEFTCMALNEAAYRKQEANDGSLWKCKQLIEEMLGPGYLTLDSWVYYHNNNLELSDARMRKVRLRWIRKIIDDLKAYAA